jgi:hypothetical protein
MAIGNSAANQFQLNTQAGQLATGLRDICARILALEAYAAGQGLTGLQAAGFSPEDAAAFLAETGELAAAKVRDFAVPVTQPGSIHSRISGLTGPS